jgi:glycosyltransferase involved in cell wall biosynthesis
MRVLTVISSLDPGMGGPPVTALNSAIAVARTGVRTEIAVVVRAGDTSAPWWQEVESRCRREGIRVHPFPVWASRLSPRRYNLSMAFARWLGSRASRRYDIVHGHSPWTGGCGVASFIAAMGTLPLVISPHEVFTPFDLSRGRLSVRVAKRVGFELYRRAADLIVCSSPLEFRDTRSSGFPSEKLAWVYHPVVDERVPAVGLEPSDPGRTGLRVGYIGRLHRKKNVDMIIEAVGRTGGQASLLIAGTGDPQLEAALRGRAQRVLPHRASFIGWVSDSDKSTFFSKIDVLVMPSMYECFGVAAIEALAAGVPVVVSDQVGIADIVRRHHAGSVITPTIDAIAGALGRYVDDPDSRSSDARRARPAALAGASLATHGAELVTCYQRLLDARS